VAYVAVVSTVLALWVPVQARAEQREREATQRREAVEHAVATRIALDELSRRIATMVDTHDRNDHERFRTLIGDAVLPPRRSVVGPVRRATTTRPRAMLPGPQLSPTATRAPTTTTTCDRLPNGRCKSRGKK
jgi:hypothetical protein